MFARALIGKRASRSCLSRSSRIRSFGARVSRERFLLSVTRAFPGARRRLYRHLASVKNTTNPRAARQVSHRSLLPPRDYSSRYSATVIIIMTSFARAHKKQEREISTVRACRENRRLRCNNASLTGRIGRVTLSSAVSRHRYKLLPYVFVIDE